MANGAEQERRGATSEQSAPRESTSSEKLPILQHAETLRTAIADNELIYVEAKTGSGKSTMLPIFAYEALRRAGLSGTISVTEPRRMAAQALGEYMNKELLPGKVGWQHGGGASRNVAQAGIVVTVDGSLSNRFKEDKLLRGVALVICDELQVQSKEMVVNQGLLKMVNELRAKADPPLPPLKIVLTTATFPGGRQRYKNFFGEGAEIEIEGRIKPIEERFLDQPVDLRDIPSVAAEEASKLLDDPKCAGDVVVFVPGRAEIGKAVERFNALRKDKDKAEAVELTGGQGKDVLDKVNHADGKPVVFFATSVAEASITFPHLWGVVDSGLSRNEVFDEETGISSLITEEHSKDEWTQRKGRAGRTMPGVAVGLFTDEQLNARRQSPEADIMRTNIASVVLLLKSMDITDVQSFDFIDHPGKERIAQAERSLYLLGAIDENGVVTDIGREMAQLPVDPHHARMLVEAKHRGCAEAVALVVSILSQKGSVFRRGPGEFLTKHKEFVTEDSTDSDFLTLLNVWNGYVSVANDREASMRWADERGLDQKTLYMVGRDKNDLAGEAYLRDANISSEHHQINISAQREDILASIVAGLSDNILVKRGDYYDTIDGRKSGIYVDHSSVFEHTRPEALVAGALRTFKKAGEMTGRTVAAFNQTISEETGKRIKAMIEAELARTKEGAILQVDEMIKEGNEVSLTEEDKEKAVGAVEEQLFGKKEEVEVHEETHHTEEHNGHALSAVHQESHNHADGTHQETAHQIQKKHISLKQRFEKMVINIKHFLQKLRYFFRQ